MKYLKLFNTHAEYAAFTATTEFLLPNVSHCIQENEVHYNPIAPPQETRLMVTYNIEDASEPTRLYRYYAEEGEEEWWTRGIDMFNKVEIDGVEVSVADLDTASGTYQLSSGEHIVAYTLKNPTLIGFDQNDPEGKAFGALFIECASITSAQIPNTVTSIGDAAFSDCYALTSINIPSGVTTIGVEAFSFCISLTSVTIPNSVTSIGESAFASCRGLTSITIPNSVTSIGDNIFNGCESLSSITLSNGVTSIGYQAFRDCHSLTSVTIPDSVISIDSYAFYFCENLSSITISNSVTSIGNCAFLGCGNLSSITIPGSVTEIGDEVFGGCPFLTSITSLAITAPTITQKTFRRMIMNGTLYVPSGSSGYDVWMGTGNYYLGLYNWTKVEQ